LKSIFMQVGCDKGNTAYQHWVLLNQIILDKNDSKFKELLLQYTIKSNAIKNLVMWHEHATLASPVLERILHPWNYSIEVCHRNITVFSSSTNL
jgi:hypothetical protein